MGNTRDTGYLRNLVTYDGSGNITLPANLTVTGTITGYATTSYVTTQINNLINGAPGLLDTLDELAAALGDDANFAATLTTSLAGKQSTLTFTGPLVNTSGTVAITQSSGSTNGFLSNTDWTTFNSKQSTLTFSGPLVNTSGTISITQSSGSTNGYLSNTDWSTFNNKQAALSGTGFVKISGTTISYDNSTYLTTASATSTYLPLAGGTLSGGLIGTTATFNNDVTVSSASSNGFIVNSTNGASFRGFRIQHNGSTNAGFEADANTGQIKIGGYFNTGDYFPVIYSDGVAALTFGIGAAPSATFLGTVQGNSFIHYINSSYNATSSIYGIAYNFAASETADGVTYSIAGGSASTTGNSFTWKTQTGGLTPTTALIINKVGNVGIGTPSPSVADVSSVTLQLKNTVVLQNVVGVQALFSNNAYYDGVSWKRVYASGAVGAMRINADNGQNGISFHVASTSTAGSTISTWDSTDIRMRINLDGSVGIGTMNPVAALNVSNVPTSFYGIIETTGTSGGTVKHFRVHKPGYVEYGIGILADNSFHISTASTFPTSNGFTITSSGSVGINTNTPTDTLQVVGSSRWGSAGNYIVSSADGGGVYMELAGGNSNQRQLRIQGINNAANSYSSIRLEAGISEIAFTTIDLERMRITSTGAVTKPYQPAFKAGMASSVSVAASGTIIFTDTGGNHFNIGGHYSTSTGLFTAPVAGRYIFSACVIYEGLSAGQPMDDACYIYKNATLVAYSFRRAEYEAGYTGNGGYYVDHLNTLLNLAVGDTVKVVNNRALAIHGNTNYCFFYGYMLG